MSKLVVIEGGEGSGKTTLIKSLRECFPTWEYTREPGGTPFAESVRTQLFAHAGYSAEAQLMLFFAARMEHLFSRIRPVLEAGHSVISDRLDASSYAYQVHGADPDLERLFWELRSIVLGELVPVYIYLDVPVEVGSSRVSKRLGEVTHFDTQSLEFHQRVRAGF